jgi:hypothetical protein
MSAGLLLMACGLLSLPLPASAAEQVTYSITDLGTLGGNNSIRQCPKVALMSFGICVLVGGGAESNSRTRLCEPLPCRLATAPLIQLSEAGKGFNLRSEL